MINKNEILSTIQMIENENLDVRTITMGISLLDCVDSDAHKACDKIIKKITSYAKNLVKTGEEIVITSYSIHYTKLYDNFIASFMCI